MERILAIQMKRIGDLVLTAPALARLRQVKPHAEISLVTMGVSGQLVSAIPSVDRHFNYRYHRPNLGLWSSLIAERFDVVLDFNGSDRSVFMAALSQADQRVTYAKRAKGFWREMIYTSVSEARLRDYHTVDHMVALLDAAGMEPADPAPVNSPPLSIPEPTGQDMSIRLSALGLDGPFAVIHPGTAREEKYWEPDRWAEVIREVSRGPRPMPCVITGGSDPRETRHIDAILSALKDGGTAEVPVVLAGKLTILETAAVIEKASLALGVDTAAMHLAAAFRIPQVILYGPINPFRWRPRHENARVVFAGHEGVMQESDFIPHAETGSMNAITASQVIEAIHTLTD